MAATISVKSPLALSGVFLDILRRRFSKAHNLPWFYEPGEEARLTNTISIEAASNPLPEERNVRPAIYVIRGPISYRQHIIGDMKDTYIPTQAKAYYATAETSFTFAVESNEDGEAAQIADVVLCTLMMGSDAIEKSFQFRKLGPFSLSSVAKQVQDRTFATVHISMGLTFDVKWGMIPIAPILQEVVVESQNTTYNSEEEYFVQTYIESLSN